MMKKANLSRFVYLLCMFVFLFFCLFAFLRFICFIYFLFVLQRVFYFPLKPKLRALLETQSYFDLLQHEFERPRNSDLITDIYDSPAWKELMGDVTSPVDRIAFQICVDAIPAFAADTYSLKPFALLCWNLPPAIRAKVQHMLLLMLLPATLKEGQKKYYDFAAKFELNSLCKDGINGIKVKIFAASLDTKGREEMLGMQACQAYQSCWACTHSWSPGSLVGRKACIYDGYRVFLAPRSRARGKSFVWRGQKYQFRYVACLHACRIYLLIVLVLIVCRFLMYACVLLQVCRSAAKSHTPWNGLRP